MPAYNGRGNAYSNKEDYARAISDYGKAIELDPKNDAVFFNRGVLYVSQGLRDLALEEFDNAVRLGYSSHISGTVDLNHACTYADGLEIATTLLEELVGESHSGSSAWHYLKGLLALYSGHKAMLANTSQ